MARQKVELKTGDDLSIACTRIDSNGDPVDISSYTVTADVKTTYGFNEALTVTVTDAATGQFTLSALAAATADWPIYIAMDEAKTSRNILYCDVQYVAGGVVDSSETFEIWVHDDITD